MAPPPQEQEAEAIPTHRFAKFNPFRADDDEGGDEYGAEMEAEGAAGGRSLGGAQDAEARKKLRVSHALRVFLAHGAKEISEADIGADDDEEKAHSAAVQAVLARPQTVNPAYVTDRSHPISEYLISSSHNTYLVGHQLYGKSDTAAYTSHLAGGARCVEIDAWDDEDSDEPKVTHGYTLTARVAFRAVCQAIADEVDKEVREAEENDTPLPLPVFISLECHCKPAGQQKLVSIMHETLGDKLVSEPVQVEGSSGVSLGALAGRVLVMVEFYADDEKEAALEAIDEKQGDAAGAKKEAAKIKIIPELSALGVYAQSMKPKDEGWISGGITDPSLQDRLLVNMEERAVLKLVEDGRADTLSQATAKHLLRVYPKGTRIDSVNMNPVPFWGVGAHVAALNWQSFDAAMQMNGALFAGTDGYALKPPYLRSNPTPRPRGQVKLTLHVAGITDLPVPKGHDADDIKPYVTCTLYTATQLGAPTKRKTSHYRRQKHKLFFGKEQPPVTSPIWDPPEELEWTFEDDELAFLRLQVKSDDAFSRNPSFAVAAVRLVSVPKGWFFLRLRNMGGGETSASALVKFSQFRE